MFSENLKKLRINANFSQKQLAAFLNVSPKTISHWENNYSAPNISQIILLKSILKTSYSLLLK